MDPQANDGYDDVRALIDAAAIEQVRMLASGKGDESQLAFNQRVLATLIGLLEHLRHHQTA